MPAKSSIAQQLASIVGSGNLRDANSDDSVCGILPKFVVQPGDEKRLAAALAFANQSGLTVIPRGGGTKLDWGNPPKSADIILSTARLDRIIEHAWADLTVTVEAGCTLQTLQQTLAQHGQRLAFDGLWPARATIGGALSTNDSGSLRLRFGPLRDLIIGVTLALPDGTLASSGGKVVKNVAGYDLPKLATGALGTLGIITRAVFRLHPLPRHSEAFSFADEKFEAMQNHIFMVQDSQLAHTSLQVRAASGAQPCVDILFEATEAGISAQESHLRKILPAAAIVPSSGNVWSSTEDLWNDSSKPLIAKITFLPAELARVLESVQRAATVHALHWQIVGQAMGIAILRLDGDPPQLLTASQQLRAEREASVGSFVVLRRPAQLSSLDAWGHPGDAAPLMRAIKNQLDPQNTLNPARFVGGI
jgi:glycolate oxidase FAD binding subunit